MKLLPLTLEIAERHGLIVGIKSVDKWSSNFQEWTDNYAKALLERDLKFTPVNKDYVFDDDENTIYLLKKLGPRTYYIPIHDRKLVTKHNEPMTGLLISQLGSNPLDSVFVIIFSISQPIFGESIRGYHIFNRLQSFMNWDILPWRDLK